MAVGFLEEAAAGGRGQAESGGGGGEKQFGHDMKC